VKQIGYVMFPSGKRLRVQASAGGVTGSLEEPSLLQVATGPASWREVKREPVIRTADELLVVMINMKQAPGFVAAMLDAWAVVVDLRSREQGGPFGVGPEPIDAAAQDVERIGKLQRKGEPN